MQTPPEPIKDQDDLLDDALLPEQLFAPGRTPGQRLCLEMLLDAIRVHLGLAGSFDRPCLKYEQENADRDWFKSDDNYPFSYVWVCENLDLNPEYLRARLDCRRPLNISRKYGRGRRLKKDDVLTILHRFHNEHQTRSEIAAHFQISRQAVGDILNGKTHQWATRG